MIRDYDMKDYKRNAFRQSKHRGEIASRVRVPGGKIDAQSLKVHRDPEAALHTLDPTGKSGHGYRHIGIRKSDELRHPLKLSRTDGLLTIGEVCVKKDHLRQKHRVAPPVGDMEFCPNRMSNTVAESDPGGIKGHPCEAGRVMDFFSGQQVLSILICHGEELHQ